MDNPGSSNGRTTDSESVYRGSNPWPGAMCGFIFDVARSLGPKRPNGRSDDVHIKDKATQKTALSSRGLGRCPLTAVTRVRIPLGLPYKPCYGGVFSLRIPRPARFWLGAIFLSSKLKLRLRILQSNPEACPHVHEAVNPWHGHRYWL